MNQVASGTPNFKSYGVVINSFGRTGDALSRGLESLDQQATRPDFVLILDQNLDGRLQSLQGQYPNLPLKYVQWDAKAISSARNKAIDLVPQLGNPVDWVLLLDDDAWLADDFSARLAEVPLDIDLLGARILCPDGTLYSNHQSGQRRLPINRLTLKKLMGGALIIRWSQLGAFRFDDLFGVGGRYPSSEETDLVLRAVRAHANVQFDPKVVVYHPPASVQSIEKAVQYGYGKGALVRKWLSRDAWAVIELAEMTAIPFVRTVRSAASFNSRLAKLHMMTLLSRWKGLLKSSDDQWLY